MEKIMNLDFNGEEELKRKKKEVAKEFSNKWKLVGTFGDGYGGYSSWKYKGYELRNYHNQHHYQLIKDKEQLLWVSARAGLENIMFEVAEIMGEPLILTNT
jgi:hypothetical protein